MAAAEMTETVYNVSPNLGGKMAKFEFTGVTTGDWVIFDDPIGCVTAVQATGAVATMLYATVDIVAAGDITSTTATVEYDEGTANQIPASGYMMCGTEIMQYSGVDKTAVTDTATLDSRGCFGTTAASHAAEDHIYILNTVVFTYTAPALIRGVVDIIGE